MKKALSVILLLCIFSGAPCCHRPASQGSGPEVQSLIDEAAKDVASQRLDAAMGKGLKALEIAEAADDALLRVRALACITGIDIMASRDADAWEKALRAEAIARENGFREELSGLLISKAKLCSYAEISPETGRNDEGLGYATEALDLAEETDSAEKQCEACYVIASLYINKNRWTNPIDPDLYRKAGDYLDRGQALAETYDLARLRRNGILFRSRWFQQGDRNAEAIRYFEQVLSTLKETDHLTASALDDRLVRLYTRTGQYQKALDAHDDYVLHIQKYIRQKSDETLQEMETRFELQAKQREIQIIRLSAEGLTAAEIAERTYLSVHTVNTHRRRIYNKMDVRNVTDMIHRATELGIL